MVLMMKWCTGRGWLDDEMFWENPRDERPGHVCNPWFWMPDSDISDISIQIRTIDDIMDHLRTIPKEVLDKKLEAVVGEREKFSFQPYVTTPPSAINIIMAKMCTMDGASAAAAAATV
jgi:hypothetical protein